MGNLKPGATYIYERANGVTYAREMGAPAEDRFVIGWDYDTQQKSEANRQIKLWGEIHRAARTNPTLQKALEQCIIVYNLSKEQDGT